jgi:hypothetical protein
MKTLSLALAVAGLLFFDLGSAPAVLSATGNLVVASQPQGAGVYVDGRFAGETPITLTHVTAGDHRVRLVKDGYLENVRIVSVAGERSATVRTALTPYAAPPPLARQLEAAGTGEVHSMLPWIAMGLGGAGVGGYLATRSPSSSSSAPSAPSAPANSRPTAGTLVAVPSTGLGASTTIRFSAAGASDPNGDALTFAWDFGDGLRATAAGPSHVYSTADTFTVTVTVSDASLSASASGTVTTKSLTGTWRGPLVAGNQTFNTTLVLSQNVASLSGTFADGTENTGTVAGSVTSNTPNITLTVTAQQTQFTFTGNPSAAINTFTGLANGNMPGASGKTTKLTNAAWTLTRQ